MAQRDEAGFKGGKVLRKDLGTKQSFTQAGRQNSAQYHKAKGKPTKARTQIRIKKTNELRQRKERGENLVRARPRREPDILSVAKGGTGKSPRTRLISYINKRVGK